MPDKSPRLLLLGMCVAEIFSMAAFATFPALIPVIEPAWSLSDADSGWISGIYFAGYVVSVPVLVSLTDRMDARRIYLISMALAALAAVGFAVLASGVWTASLWRFLQGAALGGTYMPGLKALTDRLPTRMQSRGVAFYTSSFGIGTSLSFLIAGEVDAVLHWRWAFALSAIGPVLALLLAGLILRPIPTRSSKRLIAVLDFRPVFANRRVLGYTLAYMVHNAELFALRSWVVAYLVFSQSLQSLDALGTGLRVTVIAMVVGLIGMPSSVLGNEFARRFGRPKVLFVAMSASAAVAVAVGFGAALPYPVVIALVLLYGLLVTADSATVTAGVVESADPAVRGATMAVHAMIGFVGSALGPMIFGLTLELAGGHTNDAAWGLAFTVIAAILMLGPVFIYALARDGAGQDGRRG